MNCLKGMIIGITIGMTAGVIMGATNCDLIYNALKNGRREIKRFKRKCSMG